MILHSLITRSKKVGKNLVELILIEIFICFIYPYPKCYFSTCNQYGKLIFSFLCMSLQTPLCTLHTQCVSIQTSHSSSTQ